jgi:hypothetical protein
MSPHVYNELVYCDNTMIKSEAKKREHFGDDL